MKIGMLIHISILLLTLNFLFAASSLPKKTYEELTSAQKSKTLQEVQKAPRALPTPPTVKKQIEPQRSEEVEIETTTKKSLSLFESFKQFIGLAPKTPPQITVEKIDLSLSSKNVPDVVAKLDIDLVKRVSKVMMPETWTEEDKRFIGASGSKSLERFVSEKDKNKLIKLVDDELLKIDDETYKNLPLMEKSNVYNVLQLRLKLFQTGEAVAAGIGESKKGVDRAIEAYRAEAQKRGDTEANIKKMIKEGWGNDLKKLDNDLKSLKEKFGFDPAKKGTIFDRLTKINAAIEDEVKLKEYEQRIKGLLSQKTLTSEQKAILRRDLVLYCDSFVKVYNDTPKEKQENMVRSSKVLLQKGYAGFVKSQKTLIKEHNVSIAKYRKDIQKTGIEPAEKERFEGYIKDRVAKKKAVTEKIASMNSIFKSIV